MVLTALATIVATQEEGREIHLPGAGWLWGSCVLLEEKHPADPHESRFSRHRSSSLSLKTPLSTDVLMAFPTGVGGGNASTMNSSRMAWRSTGDP